MTQQTSEKLSFWERHELKFYRYGHIYATIFGLNVIDYVPQQRRRLWVKLPLIIYGHIISLCLIVVLPIYFGYHYRALVETPDRRMQLQLYVICCNTLIKHVTVVMTYIANIMHFTAINQCTVQRTRLEAAFAAVYNGPKGAKQQFEFMMYFKFCLINCMMIVQILGIFTLHDHSVNVVRMHFALYAFVLWNYTENMADYFYFVSSSSLKYYQQSHVLLKSLLRESKLLHYFRLRRQRRGTLAQLCCLLCDRLEALRIRFDQIHALYTESFTMHQLQLLGIMLTTLISNLANAYTIFSLLADQQSLESITFPIVLNTLFALGFYIDTYIVTLVNENIKLEFEALALTMRQYAQLPTLDVRLDQEIEQFSLQLLHSKKAFALCGLFPLDRRLVFLIASTQFSYFITLVQFYVVLKK